MSETPEHWEMFWTQIFKDMDGVLQTAGDDEAAAVRDWLTTKLEDAKTAALEGCLTSWVEEELGMKNASAHAEMGSEAGGAVLGEKGAQQVVHQEGGAEQVVHQVGDAVEQADASDDDSFAKGGFVPLSDVMTNWNFPPHSHDFKAQKLKLLKWASSIASKLSWTTLLSSGKMGGDQGLDKTHTKNINTYELHNTNIIWLT